MTSNPGDEKVIQDDIRFKGDVGMRNGPSNAKRPEPDNVQSALDDAYEDGSGLVVLEAGQTYDPAETWDVYPEVTLDCTGAVIEPSTDRDVFNCHAASRVIEPEVDVSNITFTSNVFVFDIAKSDKVYNSRMPTQVLGGRSTSASQNGTCFYVHQNTAGDSVTFIDAKHRLSRFNNGIEIHSENVDGWCNSNVFDVHMGQTYRAVYQHGPGGNKYNRFEMNYQPSTSGNSAIIWDQSGDCVGNVMEGILWDTHSLTDIVWRLGTNVGSNNILRSDTPISSSDVDNQSSSRQTLRSPNRREDIGPGYAAGDGAYTAEYRNTAVGDDASATGTRSTSLGKLASAGEASLALGQNADANVTAGLAIGRGAGATANYAACLGYGNSNSNSRTLRLGDDTYHKQVYMSAIKGTLGDANIPNSHLTFEIDEANAGFRIAGRDSNGNLRSALITW